MYISDILTEKPLEATGSVLEAFELLDKLCINYEYVKNDSVESMEETSVVSEKLGCEVRKSVFLTNQKKTTFYLLIMPANKRFDTKSFRDATGVRPSFASAELMEEKIGVKPGTASLFSLLLDKDYEVELVIDKEILDNEFFACNPTDNKYHLKFKTDDLTKKLLPKMGYKAEFISLSE